MEVNSLCGSYGENSLFFTDNSCWVNYLGLWINLGLSKWVNVTTCAPVSWADSVKKHSACTTWKSRQPTKSQECGCKGSHLSEFSRNLHSQGQWPDVWFLNFLNFSVSSWNISCWGKIRNRVKNFLPLRLIKEGLKKSKSNWMSGIHLGKNKRRVVSWLEENKIEQGREL
jgi:hypothetical protein